MNTLSEKDILKSQINLLNDLIKNNGGAYIGYKLRVLEDELANFDLMREKSKLYHFYGTCEEYSLFIKKYPVKVTLASPYQLNKNEYVFIYHTLENFKIEK